MSRIIREKQRYALRLVFGDDGTYTVEADGTDGDVNPAWPRCDGATWARLVGGVAVVQGRGLRSLSWLASDS